MDKTFKEKFGHKSEMEICTSNHFLFNVIQSKKWQEMQTKFVFIQRMKTIPWKTTNFRCVDILSWGNALMHLDSMCFSLEHLWKIQNSRKCIATSLITMMRTLTTWLLQLLLTGSVSKIQIAPKYLLTLYKLWNTFV